jgi:hypothetical protein
VVTAAALLALAPATSLAGQVSLTPAAGPAGTTVLLEGSGFAPGRHVVVQTAGRRPRTVTASHAGTFRLRLGIPHGRAGWRTIVARSAALRVVNRVFVTHGAASQRILEVATSAGGHVRVMPAQLVPGATLRVNGAGFVPRRRIRLTWGTVRRSVFSDGRGRFSLDMVIPRQAPAGATLAALRGGGTQLSFLVQVLSSGASLQPPTAGPVAPKAPRPATASPAPASPAPTAPANTVAPTVSGSAAQGQTLTATNGTWRGTAPIALSPQWQRCNAGATACSPIAGATSLSYTVASGDVGSTLRIAITASNAGGSTTATSSSTAIVTPAPSGTVVALWHMDETSGTVMHDSVGANDGSLSNVTLGVPGFLNTAYGFANSTITVPDAPALNPGASRFTLTVHLKATQVPATPDWDVIRKGLFSTVGGEYKMEYQPSGQASCGFTGSAGSVELIAGPALNDGRWHTVQCVRDASDIQVVVDGQAFTKAGATGTISNTASMTIGSHPMAEFFNGDLDEVSVATG